MHAVDIYGLSEVMGPGVANECVETKDGCTSGRITLPGDHRSRLRQVLPDGERGELVFTTLTKEGMPVIRYRTRDLTRLLPGTARSMRRMEKITGRSDDMMIVRGVNVFPTQIEEQILKVKGLAPHYQIVLTREDRLDAMEILVEAAPAASDAGARSASAAELGHHVKGSIGVTATITVTDPAASSAARARPAASSTSGRSRRSASSTGRFCGRTVSVSRLNERRAQRGSHQLPRLCHFLVPKTLCPNGASPTVSNSARGMNFISAPLRST